MRVNQIRGIQATTAELLALVGIDTSEALLQAGRTPAGRKELAAKIGLDPAEVLKLVNRADLSRVRGIGEVYSNLLENAGVDTVFELSRRKAANLHMALVAQTISGDARRAPTQAEVEKRGRAGKGVGPGRRILNLRYHQDSQKTQK